MAAVDIGTGTTITFDGGFFAQILDVSHGGIERGAINTSHMGTTVAHTFLHTDLYDPGELTVELHFNPATAPPWLVADGEEAVTVTFPDATTWAANGFLTGFEYGDPLEEKMTATATIKFTGAITIV
jgi:hypothetical protein